MWKSMDMQLLQVGCPEARIDENVAKLTGAGYKVSLHKLLGPVVCIRPFALHTATCRSSLHKALCSPILQHAEVVCIWPSAIHTATCRSGLQDVPASTSAQLMACDLFCAITSLSTLHVGQYNGRRNMGAAAVGFAHNTSCMHWDHYICHS